MERPCHDDAEMARCPHFKRRQDEGFRGGAFAILLGIMLSLAVPTHAHARWKAQYLNAPFSEWYGKQADCNARNCCGSADAHDYYDGYTPHNDGSVTLSDGTTINACQVLTKPNPTGHAILWKEGNVIYCFAPGPGY